MAVKVKQHKGNTLPVCRSVTLLLNSCRHADTVQQRCAGVHHRERMTTKEKEH
jgi:hypothetical protein